MQQTRRFRGGTTSQLLPENALQLAVVAECVGLATSAGVETQELEVRGFAEGILRNRLPREVEGSFEIAACRVLLGELEECAQVRLRKAFSLGSYPVVVEASEQVTVIQLRGARQESRPL